MNDLDRQTQYANEQHNFTCVALGISFDIESTGDTLLETVRALLRDRNEWRDEAKLREAKADVWKHEVDVLRERIKQDEKELEDNISTFIDLREASITLLEERDNALSDFRQADTDSIRALHERNEARIQRDKAEDQLASERALADQLAAIVQRSRDGHGGMLTDPECFCPDCEHLRVLDAALDRWKEARK